MSSLCLRCADSQNIPKPGVHGTRSQWCCLNPFTCHRYVICAFQMRISYIPSVVLSNSFLALTIPMPFYSPYASESGPWLPTSLLVARLIPLQFLPLWRSGEKWAGLICWEHGFRGTSPDSTEPPDFLMANLAPWLPQDWACDLSSVWPQQRRGEPLNQCLLPLRGPIDRITPPPQYVEALTPDVTVFGDRTLRR